MAFSRQCRTCTLSPQPPDPRAGRVSRRRDTTLPLIGLNVADWQTVDLSIYTMSLRDMMRLRARDDCDAVLVDRVGRSIRLLADSGHPIGKLPTPILAGLAVCHYFQFNLRVASAAAYYAPSYLFRRKRLPSLKVETPKKILVVIDGNLGDCVMAIRALVAIHDAWPAAKIGILTNRVDLFRRCPFVDRCHVMPGPHPISSASLPSLTPSSAAFLSFRSRSAVAALVREIADEHYDIAVMAHQDATAYLAARARIPVRIGHVPFRLVERALKTCLTHPIPSPPSVHERHRDPTLSADALRSVGVDIGMSPRPQLWPDPAAAQRVRKRLAQWGVPRGSVRGCSHLGEYGGEALAGRALQGAGRTPPSKLRLAVGVGLGRQRRDRHGRSSRERDRPVAAR